MKKRWQIMNPEVKGEIRDAAPRSANCATRTHPSGRERRRTHSPLRDSKFAFLTVVFALFLFASPLSAADAVSEQLNNAEKIMAEHAGYGDAIVIYEKLLEQAPFDPRLLYNLGNAYALESKNGPAIWAYLRALRLAPRDEDLRHNLSIVAPDYLERLAVTPLPPADWLLYRFTANEWAKAAGLSTTLALLLIFAAIRWGRDRKWRRPALGLARAAIVAACLSWPFAILHYHHQAGVTLGVVIDENSFARMGPNEKHQTTFALPPGSLVSVDAVAKGGWLKVSFGSGNVGYIERARVRYL